MNQTASACSSSGLTRYHSAPSSVLASLTDLCDDHGFHMSADANLRAQVLLSSFFSDDFHWQQQQQQQQQQNGLPALNLSGQMLQQQQQHQQQQQQQQQQNGLPVLEPSPQMLQPYPVAAQNHLLVARSVCEGSPTSADRIPCCDAMDFDPSDGFGCATSSWSRQPVAAAAPPSSGFPEPPPKSRLLRHSSSPATLLRHFSGEFHAVGMENRHKLRQRMGSGLARGYDLQEPFLREESSDEIDEDAQFGQNSHPKKRFRGKILHQIGHLEGQAAENATMPQQLLGGLLPCNTTPCLARAKRGFATHPRSISERLRRTRISEGIKKLQELVPNIDKQMNTSDMLDEAVEYIKCLQRQVQELSKNQITSSDIKH